MNDAKASLVFGAITGFLTVALGAFGAHGLKNLLSPEMLVIFNKGVQYQGLHALALLITGLLMISHPTPGLRWAGRFFVLGILLFCGSLYLLAITHNRSLGVITPFGGLSFLAGWVFLGIACWKREDTT
jgi:uncharacterized membrane protein YgdD (TMEM256/DUF423 family)